MGTIKRFTDLAQAKKLAEILPFESADMWYQHIGISIKNGSEKPIYFPMIIRDDESDEDIPCWSLAALIDVLPKIHGLKPILDLEECSIQYSGVDLYITAGNIVDVCVDMILKLNELKIL